MLNKLVLFFLLVSSLISAQWRMQSPELLRYYKLIEHKVDEDAKYLNVKYITLEPNVIADHKIDPVPLAFSDEKFQFKNREGITYHFYYIDETVDIDSMVLIAVKEEEDRSATSTTLFGSGSPEDQIVTTTVLKFRDLHQLYNRDRTIYDELINLVKEYLKGNQPQALLDLGIDTQVKKSKGISAKDNQDYLNFEWVNGRHHYPKIKSGTAQRGRGRGRGRGAGAAGTQYKIDASLSHATFFYKGFDFGFSGVSAELNFQDHILNVLPYQPMTMSIGVRGLVAISSGKQNLLEDYMLDFSILARARLNFASVATALPWIFLEAPKLNVGSGIIFYLKTTRAFGMPFVNLYFAGGSSDVSNPYVTSVEDSKEVAYFSFNQWESTFSFFWNTDETQTFRFKMDIGIGGFNVVKAIYETTTTEENVYTAFQPLIRVNGTFVPSKDNELFGANLRYFDSVIKVGFWFKVLTLAKVHNFRFETTFFMSPMFRGRRPWEPESASMFQIRYRYGF